MATFLDTGRYFGCRVGCDSARNSQPWTNMTISLAVSYLWHVIHALHQQDGAGHQNDGLPDVWPAQDTANHVEAVLKLGKANPHRRHGKQKYPRCIPPTSPHPVGPACPPSPPDELMPPADGADPFTFDDARSWHRDFQFDTPGASSSGNCDAAPAFVPHLVATEDQPPLTLRDTDWWAEGLTTAEVLSHKLSKEMARGGGFKLSEEDLLLVETFNYKVDTKISGKAFSKFPRAFHQQLSDLPSEDRIRMRVTALSGMGAFYSTAASIRALHTRAGTRNSTSVHIVTNPAINVTNATPIVSNPEQIQNNSWEELRRFDGVVYHDLKGKHVVVDGEELEHNYFELATDIALGLSTDGFGPWKKRSSTCWPIILFIYNLPPSIRVKLEHILCLGVIPGPNSPKDINT
ncbi:hypothetical protein FRC06_008973, partial [Ceratobasidium sp. 370]